MSKCKYPDVYCNSAEKIMTHVLWLVTTLPHLIIIYYVLRALSLAQVSNYCCICRGQSAWTPWFKSNLLILNLNNAIRVPQTKDEVMFPLFFLICCRKENSLVIFYAVFSQEMTIPWCLKRAELVFKCVKGESLSISQVSCGSDSKFNK